MTDPLVSTYVDRALEQIKRKGLMIFPGDLPAAMQDPSIPPQGDWRGWQAMPSGVTAADLDSLEVETGLAYPPLYRDFLRYRHFVDLTQVGVRFERHFPAGWRAALRSLYFDAFDPARILGRGLLPFGSETCMDAGPVCFDTRLRREDGDCPVVYWDHDWVGDEREIRPMFSSAAAMFRCLSFAAGEDLDFVHHDVEGDPPEALPGKQAALRRFLELDPEGAGGTARDYWTTWGVDPGT
ncbi:MAG: SMI1/KNR4 family protein [Kiloniellales bacterium]|nr:SMI1/KNR4 family protein [Kiloniellales bacterium]